MISLDVIAGRSFCIHLLTLRLLMHQLQLQICKFLSDHGLHGISFLVLQNDLLPAKFKRFFCYLLDRDLN